ncbi:hypothetical protein DPMN_033760 [Dreissena polymorpha]|uniref:Uncharacterized protein n=1 Tax=Dreissena polymorpha TaxID=45954 RepID=A0A9D4RLA2_DREPO|nr:hypothetical protein DPMN_033760 [Dreissena polymorpha]
MTITAEDAGGRFSIWRTCSGSAGFASIYPCCRNVRNGMREEETCKLETLC